MARFPDGENVQCSFCGKPKGHVKKMIAGPGVCICNECIELCAEIIAEDVLLNEGSQIDDMPTELPKPMEIKAALDEYVIGQEKAKRVLSVAVYNHYKRIRSGNISDGVELQKSNILMLGPTGSGKTLLAQTLARVLDVPFAMADATSLTEAGYVGEDVENILLKLIQAADYDIERAERGIIYIDEIDKISRKSENPSITRDVSGEGVQQTLLKILEGTVASVPPQGGRKHPHQELLQIDTTNILFICGGAFCGIENIIRQRVSTKTMGFGAEISAGREDSDALLAKAQPEDLLKFGLIPEFVGRLPIMVTLNSLDKAALLKVLTEPKNALVKQYQKLLEMDGVELRFEDGVIEAVAEEALARKTGARGLRAIFEELMMDTMFEVPSREDAAECVVTVDTLQKRQPPVVITRQEMAGRKTSA